VRQISFDGEVRTDYNVYNISGFESPRQWYKYFSCIFVYLKNCENYNQCELCHQMIFVEQHRYLNRKNNIEMFWRCLHVHSSPERQLRGYIECGYYCKNVVLRKNLSRKKMYYLCVVEICHHFWTQLSDVVTHNVINKESRKQNQRSM